MQVDIQGFLDNLWDYDKYDFLKGVSNWNNHRPLLLLSLELTKDKNHGASRNNVIELGAGNGSTPYLR